MKEVDEDRRPHIAQEVQDLSFDYCQLKAKEERNDRKFSCPMNLNNEQNFN